MTVRLSVKQQEALESRFGMLLGNSERTFSCVNMQMPISGPVPEATLMHCGGADAALFWEARGLKGYRFDRDEQQRRQREELTKVAGRVFDEDGVLRQNVIGPFLSEAVSLFGQVFSDGNPFEAAGLADKKVVIVLGFWRSLGTLMLWRVLRRVGMNPATLNPFMLHDNMPDVAVLERHTYWQGHISAYFQFCQYLAWAKEAFAGPPVLVQKNASHLYWLQSLDSMLGDRATYQFTIRHPVPSAVSLVSTWAADGDTLLTQRTELPITDVWWTTVNRAFGMSREEWRQLPLIEQAIEHWAAYHVLADLNGNLAKRLHVFRFGDDLEGFLSSSLPVSVDAPPEEGETVAPSPRNYDRYMTPAVIARSASAIDRAKHHFATYGIILPDLTLV